MIALFQLKTKNKGNKNSIPLVKFPNFETGKFRWYVHPQSTEPQQNEWILKKKLRAKKGFTDLLMISGKSFLQGIVVIHDPA